MVKIKQIRYTELLTTHCLKTVLNYGQKGVEQKKQWC